jgi:hypothetical protein
VARHAVAQHGVFSRAQAIEAGFTARMITRRLMSDRWASADRAVYRATATPVSWELTVMAACLGGPAVASHRSAARLWRFPGFHSAPAEVTAYRHRRRRAPTVVWHESRYLTEMRDTTVLHCIPTTSATRTIIDLSSVATMQEIEIALDDACHRGLTTTTRVANEMDRMQRLIGTGRIRSVLELKVADGAPAESPLESRTAMILRSSGLPLPTPQFEVFDGATFVGRVDFAWPDHRVVLEVDGFSVHGDRQAWDRDLERRSRLATAGWRVHHVTHSRLAHPVGIIAELRRSLSVH